MAVRETKCKMNFYSAQMKQANSSNGQIGNIEAGKAFPSFELILRIADAFSIHPADLFLRDSSKVQDRELYSKYHELLLNCEHLPECHKPSIHDWLDITDHFIGSLRSRRCWVWHYSNLL